MTGNFILAILAYIKLLVWYGEPSSKIVVSSIQPGFSLSSYSMNVRRKRHIASAFVLH